MFSMSSKMRRTRSKSRFTEAPQKVKAESDRLKPLSFYPLTPEKALSAFMRVKPKKVTKATERDTQKKKP